MSENQSVKLALKNIFLFLIWPLGAGIILSLLDRGELWMADLTAYTSLLLIAWLILQVTKRRLSLPRPIQILTSSVFWMRLGLGVLLALLLPTFGYQDNPASKAGYVFQDAFRRDHQAWSLAGSDHPVLKAFSAGIEGEQYGGLLALSAFTYRYFSPDIHRPALVLIWVALAGALSTGVFWKAVHVWLEERADGIGVADAQKTATLASLVFALYPEVILLGISQMREAFVLLGGTFLFLGFVKLSTRLPSWWREFSSGSILLLLFQPPMAVVSIIVVFVLWLLEPGVSLNWKHILFFVGFAAIGIVFMVSVWNNLPALASLDPIETVTRWVQLNFNFQAHISERSSGMIQKLLRSVGEPWALPVVLGYGALQPVLPAALIDPAAWLWRIITSLRAAGWYAMAPILVFSIFAASRWGIKNRRWGLVWLSFICLVWVGVSAAVAGGDQWDNPRYRTQFLPWMAFLVAWGWDWAVQNGKAWLIRAWIAEGLFVVVFLEWYISRIYPALPHMDVRFTIGLAIIVIIAFLAGSIGWDILQRNRKI